VEALQAAMGDPRMLELAADAARVSSGGPPTFLIGIDAE
jgi:hypothetical protein